VPGLACLDRFHLISNFTGWLNKVKPNILMTEIPGFFYLQVMQKPLHFVWNIGLRSPCVICKFNWVNREFHLQGGGFPRLSPSLTGDHWQEEHPGSAGWL
jgi:hypothetical protein